MSGSPVGKEVLGVELSIFPRILERGLRCYFRLEVLAGLECSYVCSRVGGELA